MTTLSSVVGGGGGSNPVKSGVMEGAGAAMDTTGGGVGLNVMALIVLLSCLLYMLLIS